MFGKTGHRHIDLHLPQSWNHCTTEELEAIAAAIINEQQHVGRYHPFDWQRVKLNVVLAINGLHVVSVQSPTDDDDNDSTFIVNRSKEEGDFPITTGQMLSLTERLSWLDDEKSDKTVFLFPYRELTFTMDNGKWKMDNVKKKSSIINSQSSITVAGPPPLLDGYTWREYRWLTDWIQEYMRLANALAQIKNEESRVKNQAALDNARNEFLAVLFKPEDNADNKGQQGTAEANSSLFTLHSSFFVGFSPIKWQTILFWWSSLMAQLAKKFPRVFKSQPVGKKRRPQKKDTPWDFYNRVTATIQKYVGGLSAQDVDNQPYGVTLQQLEMMADEAAEMEKIKHKNGK